MPARTGAEYLDGLRGAREVWFNGERIREVTRERHVSTWPVFWTWRMPVRKVRLSVLGCPVYFFTPREIEQHHDRAGFVLRKLERVGEIYCTLAEPRR